MPKKRWRELDERLNEIAQINKEVTIAQQKTESSLKGFINI